MLCIYAGVAGGLTALSKIPACNIQVSITTVNQCNLLYSNIYVSKLKCRCYTYCHVFATVVCTNSNMIW